MNQNEVLHDPYRLGVPSGASKMISELMVRSVQTVHLSLIKISTISKRTETRFHLRLWYVWCKLWIYLAPTLTLSPNGPKRYSTWPTLPRSSIRCVQNDFWVYGTFGANRAPILNQDWHHFQTIRNELPFDPRHPGVPSGASKTISKPMVCLAQTMLLSCTEANTISKRRERRFYMTHITYEFHQVCPKQFLKLWYTCGSILHQS
jgi:hypothetical protein